MRERERRRDPTPPTTLSFERGPTESQSRELSGGGRETKEPVACCSRTFEGGKRREGEGVREEEREGGKAWEGEGEEREWEGGR
eukprot:1389681-Rhodomonas_salina.1